MDMPCHARLLLYRVKINAPLCTIHVVLFSINAALSIAMAADEKCERSEERKIQQDMGPAHPK